MPRKQIDDPSPAALRKRAQRAALAADPDRKAKAAAYAREYRARKKAEREAAAVAALRAVDEQGPGEPPPRAAVDCQKKLCDEIGDTIRDLSRLSRQAPAQRIPAMKVRKEEAKEAVQKELIRFRAAQSAEAVGKALFDHSQAHDEGENVISEKTAVAYAKRVLFLQKMVTGKRSTVLDFEFLRDVDGVWDSILSGVAATGKNKGQPWSTSSKIVYAGAITGILRRLEGFEAEYARYSKLYTDLHRGYDDERKENRLTNAERERFVRWPELVKLWEKELRRPTLPLRDLALVSVYVGIPPRRAADYQLMRVATEGDRLSNDKNWLVLSAKNGKPMEMVFNVYKTAKRYGQYRRGVPPKLARILQSYITEADILDGDPLFPTEKGTPYVPGAFSNLVGSIFEKLTGQRASVNILRHSAITDFLGQKRTVKAKEAFAKEMGHSVAMQALYDRIDAPEDSGDDE